MDGFVGLFDLYWLIAWQIFLESDYFSRGCWTSRGKEEGFNIGMVGDLMLVDRLGYLVSLQAYKRDWRSLAWELGWCPGEDQGGISFTLGEGGRTDYVQGGGIDEILMMHWMLRVQRVGRSSRLLLIFVVSW